MVEPIASPVRVGDSMNIKFLTYLGDINNPCYFVCLNDLCILFRCSNGELYTVNHDPIRYDWSALQILWEHDYEN